ncbi:hypothetical protein [Streptomyces sp. 2A115]|uniref:hypothetical protein n=1 Tax=Streptomyces sp. 2A115 TaxID=3457439 RepID=UPI003FCFE90A
MRVRMKVALSGTRDGAPWPPVGGTADVPQGEAEHLLTAGLAEALGAEAPAEENTAAKGEPETAVPPRRRRSTGKS